MTLKEKRAVKQGKNKFTNHKKGKGVRRYYHLSPTLTVIL